MGSFFTAIGQVFAFMMALPKMIEFFNSMQRTINEAARVRREKEENQRREDLSKAAERLQKAQGEENETAQEDALSGIVDDYNRLRK
jgi:hypothetical protein